ncbi:MAG TPA: hypothetical protein VFZ52_03530 [Chryseolinea sp.]
MNLKSKSIFLFVFALVAIGVASCDIYRPQKNFRLAVPKNDALYGYILSHLRTLLEQNGYEVTVLSTDRNIDANRMVARGEADLAFINNVSSHIVEALGVEGGRLRTVVPITRRALLGFSRESVKGTQSVRQIFENKIIGVEIINGEGHGNIKEMLQRARVSHGSIVQSNEAPYDVRIIWGSPYGKRALEMQDSGWHAISFSPEWIEFQTLNDPALSPIILPALPGDVHSNTLHSIATDAVLVANQDLGEHAIYRLAETILQGKGSLIREDPMYRSITESINRETLLYPLHEGTASYLRRDTPAFLERYADSLALVLSCLVLLYSIVQAVKARMNQIKKDRIDKYFLEFLDIRSKTDLSAHQQALRLNDLFQRALLQMTNEKMDKGDFHIFSRLIQQELTILQLVGP